MHRRRGWLRRRIHRYGNCRQRTRRANNYQTDTRRDTPASPCQKSKSGERTRIHNRFQSSTGIQYSHIPAHPTNLHFVVGDTNGPLRRGLFPLDLETVGVNTAIAERLAACSPLFQDQCIRIYGCD